MTSRRTRSGSFTRTRARTPASSPLTRSCSLRPPISIASAARGGWRPESSSAESGREAASATLKGSLVLVGDGDPALAVSGFAAARNLPLTSVGPLAKAVKDAGIRTSRGRSSPTRRSSTAPDRSRCPASTPDPGDLPTSRASRSTAGPATAGATRRAPHATPAKSSRRAPRARRPGQRQREGGRSAGQAAREPTRWAGSRRLRPSRSPRRPTPHQTTSTRRCS